MVTMTVRSDLTRIQRTNLETCITVHMHQKESTEDLVRRKVGLNIGDTGRKTPANNGRAHAQLHAILLRQSQACSQRRQPRPALQVRDPTDFDWLKQVRFYWREERDTVIISICDVDFEYRWGA
jgi:dynein heavy chain